jgi:anti-sigma B factor antagonist
MGREGGNVLVTIHARDEERVTVLEVIGRMVLREGERPLHEAVTGLLSRGRRRILVDLSGVDAMDSLGISDLIGAYTRAQRSGGDLKILRPSHKIQVLMETAALDQLFEIFSEEDEAFGSFLAEHPDRSRA